MGGAKSGDRVKVHYMGKFEDGTVFDASHDRGPLEFTIGEGTIIRGFEEAVVGMNPGESKTANVPVDKAFGPHRKEMVAVLDRRQIPADLKPQVGQQLEMRHEGEKPITVMVTAISESDVTVDANHPLAGKDLTFDIQLVEIV